MKNISPQPAARQNNCRNTSPAAIASQAGVDKGRPLCKAELGCCGSRYFTGATHETTMWFCSFSRYWYGEFILTHAAK